MTLGLADSPWPPAVSDSRNTPTINLPSSPCRNRLMRLVSRLLGIWSMSMEGSSNRNVGRRTALVGASRSMPRLRESPHFRSFVMRMSMTSRVWQAHRARSRTRTHELDKGNRCALSSLRDKRTVLEGQQLVLTAEPLGKRIDACVLEALPTRRRDEFVEALQLIVDKLTR